MFVFIRVNWCVCLCIPACSIFTCFSHTHVQTQQSTKCMHRQTLSEYWTLWLHRVVNWQLQIPAMRYNQFHLHLLCLLLHIFGGNCNWNEWLVRPNNGHCKWP